MYDDPFVVSWGVNTWWGVTAPGKHFTIAISYQASRVLAILMMAVCMFEIQRIGRKLLKEKKEPNLCPKCSYDLRVHLAPNSSAGPNCPECGTPIAIQKDGEAP